MYVCMFVCVYVCCMYVGYVHIIAPLRSVLVNGECMYHRQVSYGRHMCVSRTLTDLTFTDSSQTNDAFTRAHLIQNKVKNCVVNGWLAIILAVMPVAVMQLAVIILAVIQLADIKLVVMQLAVIKLAVIGWNRIQFGINLYIISRRVHIYKSKTSIRV